MEGDLPVEPSELFKQAVLHSGSCHISCELCDRTHFSTDTSFDWEEGELESLLEKAEAEPDMYINHGNDSPSWGFFNDKQAVVDCPCNKLKGYEDFIWDNRHVIAKYLKARANEIRLDAIRQAEAMDTIPNDLG